MILKLFHYLFKQLSAELEGRLLNSELARIAITDSLTGIANEKKRLIMI